jgi:hypothetical protein
MMIKAKEKPIIFSTPSIPSIQNLKPGTWPPEPIDPGKPWKWQTRRIVKDDIVNGFDIDIDGKVIAYIDQATGDSYKPEEICPYPPGTRLWVRETWQKNYWNEAMVPNKYAYKASPETWIYFSEEEKRLEKKWRSPHFMPKAAARLWLEVKNVRVERIKEISNEDILAEGINDLGSYGANYDYFANEIWDSINAKRGYPWRSNPWVWVYEFMRTEAMP